MNWLKIFAPIAVVLSGAHAAFAQTEPAEEPPASPGIVFLKPPSSPILGVQKISPDVVDIITRDDIRSLVTASDFTFTRRGLASVYRARLKGNSVQLSNRIMQELQVDPAVFWIVDAVEIDAVINLSEPWSRSAYDAGTIRVNEIEVTKVALNWGGIAFNGDGNLTVDVLGLVSGKLDLRVTSWNPDFSLTDRLAGAQTSELDSLLQVVLVGGELTIPLNFDHGIVKIGILPVGNVPALLPSGV